MISDWLLIGCGIAVLACGLSAGFFLTFSDFLMESLGAARPASGIEAMQMINRKVYKSKIVFMLWSILATAPLLIGAAYFQAADSVLAWTVTGGVIYFLGVYVVTFVKNVPMNNELDLMDPSAPEASAYWRSTYLPIWTYWNYVRAIATTVSAACYLVATMLLVQVE